MMRNDKEYLALGTAQLGMRYGLGRNSSRVISEKEVFSIIGLAYELGLYKFDTSPLYGLAEARLSNFFLINSNFEFEVSTKIKGLPISDHEIPNFIDNFIKLSPFIKMANCKKLTILLHSESDVMRPSVTNQLQKHIELGNITNWGVSLYKPKFVQKIATIEGCTDVQLPFGILNQEFQEAEAIEFLYRHKVNVSARSVFTQGLVFSRNYKKLAPKSAEIECIFRDLKNCANESGLSMSKYAFEFARQNKYISTFVVGVDDCDQLIDLVSNTDIEKIMPLKYETISAIKKHRPLFLPQNWSNQQISQN